MPDAVKLQQYYSESAYQPMPNQLDKKEIVVTLLQCKSHLSVDNVLKEADKIIKFIYNQESIV